MAQIPRQMNASFTSPRKQQQREINDPNTTHHLATSSFEGSGLLLRRFATGSSFQVGFYEVETKLAYFRSRSDHPSRRQPTSVERPTQHAGRTRRNRLEPN